VVLVPELVVVLVPGLALVPGPALVPELVVAPEPHSR